MAQRFFNSFKYAAKGLRFAFKTQFNFRVHLLVALMVLLAGWQLQVSLLEWLVIAVCIGGVLAVELINTAIETLVDMVSPNFNAKAGLVKDIAAAAVLVVAFMAFIIGLVIFVPKIL